MKKLFLTALLFALLPLFPAHAINVQTGSFTGDGLDDKVIALDTACTPVVVAVKRNSSAHFLIATTTTIGTPNAWTWTNSSGTPSTTCLKTFTATGFTLGTSSSCNANGVTHYYLAICDNGAEDIAVSSYTGSSGSDNRDITISPAFPPELVIVIPASGALRVWRGASSHSGDQASVFSGAGAPTANYIQGFNANGFQVGTSYNTDAVPFHYIAIKGSASGVQTGSYTGDTNDDREIPTTFQPEFAAVKQDGTADGPSYRFASNSAGESFCLSEVAAVNQIQAFNATDFQVGTDNCANDDGDTMRWFALADVSPSSSGSFRRRHQ